jgi:hypothetical protein
VIFDRGEVTLDSMRIGIMPILRIAGPCAYANWQLVVSLQIISA